MSLFLTEIFRFIMTAGVNVHTTSERYIERRIKSRHFELSATRFHSHERHAYHKHVVVLQGDENNETSIPHDYLYGSYRLNEPYGRRPVYNDQDSL